MVQDRAIVTIEC